MRSTSSPTTAKGFTLLELLIVIAIIAILATIMVIVINPIETLRRARDVQRLSDLSSVRTAIAMYMTVTPVPDLNGANPGTCYATPATATGRIYLSQLAASTLISSVTYSGTNSSIVDGTGWIPVNLSAIAGGSPLAAYPQDPSQGTATLSAAAMTASSTPVYRYACSDAPLAFEMTARLESIAYGDTAAVRTGTNKMETDGGNNAGVYEVGTNLQIID